MKTHRLDNSQEVFRAGESTGHLVAATERADVVVLNLAPGAHIPAHALEVNVLFAVAEGSATLTANGQSGELREWRNSGSETCRVFVVKQK